MDILAISVNHATTAYTDLMLATLLDVDRTPVEVVVLDNDSPDVAALAWSAARGVTVRPSGYGHQPGTVTTHGEILRAAVLDRPDPDAWLLLDADAFFLTRGTIATMADELAADPTLFAVQARQADETGQDQERPHDPWTHEIEERVRDSPGAEWWPPVRYPVTLGERAHPFCLLLRNTPVVRRTVELIGFSPALTQCHRGGTWWDTLGLFTQVMRTHGQDWAYSSRLVGHFGNVSWSTEWSGAKAERRDRLRDAMRAPRSDPAD